METVQVPVPLQAPPHPENVWPLNGVAVSVTLVRLRYVALQPLAPAVPLLMVHAIAGVNPDWLATEPLPLPWPVTVS